MKACSKCKEVKPLSMFHKNKNSKDGLTYWCSVCATASTRKWHHTVLKPDAERRRKNDEVQRLARIERKKLAMSFFGNKCFDCGGVFPPSVYDFHHTDPTQKERNIAYYLNSSFSEWQEEAKKCVMLCSNCHRIRHHETGVSHITRKVS